MGKPAAEFRLAAQLAANCLHQPHGPADRATAQQDECDADGEDGQNRLALVHEGPVDSNKSRQASQQMARQGFAAKDEVCAMFRQRPARPRFGDIP